MDLETWIQFPDKPEFQFALISKGNEWIRLFFPRV